MQLDQSNKCSVCLGAGAGAGSCDNGDCHLGRGWTTTASEAIDRDKKFCSAECAEEWVANRRAELRQMAGGMTTQFDALCELSGDELVDWIDEHDDDDPLLYVAQKLLYDLENTEVSDEMRWELFLEAIHQPRTEGEDY